MKKNQLTTALFAAFAGVVGIASMSNAVNINPDGTGQVLVYPYYTVNGANDTLISVVNTSNQVKAVKVRFHEAVNSREVLDFNLYLSPFDVWTAAVTRNTAAGGDAANGAAVLITGDTSCTVPDIRTNTLLPTLGPGGPRYAAFSLLNIPGAPASQTRDGYLEMIEMGVVGAVAGFNPAGAATHGANGIPASCATLVAAFSPGGVWFSAPNTAIAPPTGGLFGGALIVDAPRGRLTTYNASAFEGFGYINPQQTNSGDVNPNLNTLFAATGAGPAQASVFVNGRLVTSTYAGARRIDALSATIAFTNVVNEYNFNAALNARTEWIVTFPTKRFYTDPAAATGVAPVAPFTAASSITGGGCEAVSMTAYNREEARAPFVQFSPSRPPSLCGEANVVTLEALPPGGDGTSGLPALATTPIFAARTASAHVARFGIPGFTEGWAELSFITPSTTRAFIPSMDGDVWVGLPTVGFWGLAIDNTSGLPGVQAFYNGAFTHRGARRCENAAGC